MLESIYNKALELIKTIGVNFKMDDIASEMGISKKTIYKHYPSKEVLIKRMINECGVTVQSNNRSIIYNNSLSEVNKLFLLLEKLPKESVLYTRNVLEGLHHYYPIQANALEEHLTLRRSSIKNQFEYAIKMPYMEYISFDVFYAMYTSMFDLWQSNTELDIEEIKSETMKTLRRGLIVE